MLRRSLILTLLVGLLWTTHSDPLAAESDCADYISSGGGSSPFFGTLIGSRKITSTVHWGTTLSPIPRFGSTFGGSTTTEYWVGTYAGSGGGTVDVNCGTYTLI